MPVQCSLVGWSRIVWQPHTVLPLPALNRKELTSWIDYTIKRTGNMWLNSPLPTNRKISKEILISFSNHNINHNINDVIINYQWCHEVINVSSILANIAYYMTTKIVFKINPYTQALYYRWCLDRYLYELVNIAMHTLLEQSPYSAKFFQYNMITNL